VIAAHLRPIGALHIRVVWHRCERAIANLVGSRDARRRVLHLLGTREKCAEARADTLRRRRESAGGCVYCLDACRDRLGSRRLPDPRAVAAVVRQACERRRIDTRETHHLAGARQFACANTVVEPAAIYPVMITTYMEY